MQEKAPLLDSKLVKRPYTDTELKLLELQFKNLEESSRGLFKELYSIYIEKLLEVSWMFLCRVKVALTSYRVQLFIRRNVSIVQRIWIEYYKAYGRFTLWLANVRSLCLDMLVYRPYYRFKSIVHIMSKTMFVARKKWVFNKKHLLDPENEPKFKETTVPTESVPGFSIESHYTVFVDGNVQKKDKIIKHKFDFDHDISAVATALKGIELEVFQLECYLWTLYSYIFTRNSFLLVNKVEKAISVHEAKLQSLTTSAGRWRSVVPRGVLLDDLSIFSFAEALFMKSEGMQSIYKSLVGIKESLLKINTDRGYILSIDLFNEVFYPYIAPLLKQLITKKAFLGLNNHKKVSCYVWVTNVIFINIFSICAKALYSLKLVDLENAPLDAQREWKELHSRFRVLKNWSYNMLDNSIKQHLIKRNLTINSDVVSGFDTEYVALDWNKNELLSAQLSSSHVLKLTVPVYEEYNFEGVNTLTSETYMSDVPPFTEPGIKRFISEKITESRSYMFGEHDKIMRKIVNYFYNNDKVLNVAVTSKSVLFAFDKSIIRNLFILPKSGEKLELSFTSLIAILTHNCAARDLAEAWLVDELSYAMSLDISSEKIRLVVRHTPSWDAETMKNSETTTVFLSNERNLENESNYGKKSGHASNFVVKVPAAATGTNVQPDSLSASLAPLAALAPLGAPLGEGELGGEEFLRGDEVSINIRRKIFLAAHYNAADFTLLSDWNSVSYKNIDILKRGYSSLAKAVVYNGKEKVYLRDTIALVSATAKSLEAVAYAYKLKKVDVSQYYKENMDMLLKENPELFKEYAMTDSLITLIHMLFINDFSFRLGSINIPNTLGTLSSRYIKNKWRVDEYPGYQLHVNYPLGDARASHTPKGIQFGSSTLEMANLFIGSYRGGRNECFRYGIDKSTKWYDYDLTSCYSTVMSLMGDPLYERTEAERIAALAESIIPEMGDPDYNRGKWIHPKSDLTNMDFLKSYSALKVKFVFPKEVSYPPLPVTLDESITIYPSSGVTLVTGLEYLSACSILNKTIDRFGLSPKEYYIEILYGAYIPFKTRIEEQPDGSKSEVMSYSPFFELINELQANRKMWKKATGKGSAMERIYKDLGNMLYGKIVCGIANKKSYDVRSDSMTTMIGNDLSNPILGTWITGFVRSLIAELLHAVDLLGGQVVSCTTDGFVTDIEDLEKKILALGHKNTFLEQYRAVRLKLSGDPSGLEVKTSVKGLLQWTTRGQLSLEDGGIPITAMTGYQKSRQHSENVSLVQQTMINGNKVLFLQKQLSGALDCYKNKAHVSMKTSQRKFTTVFDSKRFIIESDKTMLESRPFTDSSEALLHRKLMLHMKSTIYSDQYSVFTVPPSKNAVEEVVKYFLRMVSHIFAYNIPITLKFALASILHSIEKSISEKYILDLISAYETDKGNVVTKLPVFKISSAFVLDLFNELAKLKDHEYYSLILTVFRQYFDNFSCLPPTPEQLKQEMLKKITSIPAERLIFSEDSGTITIKVLKE